MRSPAMRPTGHVWPPSTSSSIFSSNFTLIWNVCTREFYATFALSECLIDRETNIANAAKCSYGTGENRYHPDMRLHRTRNHFHNCRWRGRILQGPMYLNLTTSRNITSTLSLEYYNFQYMKVIGISCNDEELRQNCCLWTEGNLKIKVSSKGNRNLSLQRF